ncbi:MAG: hypothetical protein ABR522_00870 [Marinobacter sp.]
MNREQIHGKFPYSGRIFTAINQWIGKAQDKSWPIIASRDWRRVDHVSFRDRGGSGA